MLDGGQHTVDPTMNAEAQSTPVGPERWSGYLIPIVTVGLCLLAPGLTRLLVWCTLAYVCLHWWNWRALPGLTLSLLLLLVLGSPMSFSLLPGALLFGGPIIGWLLLRLLWADPSGLASRRDLLAFLALGASLPAAVSALLLAHTLQEQVPGRGGFVELFRSGLILSQLLSVPLLYFGTPLLRRLRWVAWSGSPEVPDAAISWPQCAAYTAAGLACMLALGFWAPGAGSELLAPLPLLVFALLAGAKTSVLLSTILLGLELVGISLRRPNALLDGSAWQWFLLASSVGAILIGRSIADLRRKTNRAKGTLRALRRQERFISTLVDHMPAVIFVKNLQGTYELVNREFERISARRRDEMLGKNDYQLYPTELADYLTQNDRDVLLKRSAQSYEENVPSPVEIRSYISIKFPLFDERGEPEAVCGIATDVTDIKHSNKRLKDSEAFLNMALDAARMGTWSWDCQTNELRWSESIPGILGFQPDEFDGHYRTIHRHVLAEDRARTTEAFRAALSTDGPDLRVEYRLAPGKSVRTRWVETRGLVVRDHWGHPLRLTGTVTDITERKQLEASLLQSQKTESIGRLAGGVAHDFNNLLTSILGLAELVRQNLRADPRSQEYLSHIIDAARRGGDLTQQLLGYARKQVSQPQVLALNDAISRAMELLYRLVDARVDIEYQPDPELWNVHVDPVQIDQVLMNLCLNARDSMPNGGTITIKTDNCVLTQPSTGIGGSVGPGNYVRLQVSDTGHGIPAELLPKIFDPFFTTKAVDEGTGLGLSTCLGIVEQCKGRIKVESVVGSGTTFEVLLPATSSPQAPAAAPKPESHIRTGNETILLVEDDSVIRSWATTTLRQLGYTILEASNGVAALEVAARTEATIDLLVTDVIMPKMGGRELAASLTRQRPDILVLFTSGYSEAIVESSSNEDGPTDFLQKPYPPHGLENKIRSMLDRRKKNGSVS